jgi:hypothetical protein
MVRAATSRLRKARPPQCKLPQASVCPGPNAPERVQGSTQLAEFERTELPADTAWPRNPNPQSRASCKSTRSVEAPDEAAPMDRRHGIQSAS